MGEELNRLKEENERLKKGLVEIFVNSGSRISRRLVEELVRQDGLERYLIEAFGNDRYWDENADPHIASHLLYLLGLKAGDKYLEVLKYAVKTRLEEIGDLVTEDLPSILYPFACKNPAKVWEIALDERFYVFVRSSAVHAICAVGVTNENMTPAIAGDCKKLLACETDETLIGLSLPVMAELKDEGLWETVKETYEKLPSNRDYISRDGLDELHRRTSGMPEYLQTATDLWDHFSDDNLEWLYEDDYDGEGVWRRDVKIPKTGRNESCPCGSGKKYKKCCGKNG